MRQFVWVVMYIPVHVCIYDIQVMTLIFLLRYC